MPESWWLVIRSGPRGVRGLLPDEASCHTPSAALQRPQPLAGRTGPATGLGHAPPGAMRRRTAGPGPRSPYTDGPKAMRIRGRCDAEKRGNGSPDPPTLLLSIILPRMACNTHRRPSHKKAYTGFFRGARSVWRVVQDGAEMLQRGGPTKSCTSWSKADRAIEPDQSLRSPKPSIRHGQPDSLSRPRGLPR